MSSEDATAEAPVANKTVAAEVKKEVKQPVAAPANVTAAAQEAPVANATTALATPVANTTALPTTLSSNSAAVIDEIQREQDAKIKAETGINISVQKTSPAPPNATLAAQSKSADLDSSAFDFTEDHTEAAKVTPNTTAAAPSLSSAIIAQVKAKDPESESKKVSAIQDPSIAQKDPKQTEEQKVSAIQDPSIAQVKKPETKTDEEKKVSAI